MEFGLLLIRLVVGLTLAAHGALKLFGFFGGYGTAGTGDLFESLGFRPGKVLATMAGLGEIYKALGGAGSPWRRPLSLGCMRVDGVASRPWMPAGACPRVGGGRHDRPAVMPAPAGIQEPYIPLQTVPMPARSSAARRGLADLMV